MSRSDQILEAIKTLATNTSDIEASAVVDNDGLTIASALPQGLDDDSVAALSAAVLGISERISRDLERGDFEMVMVQGSRGYQLTMRCGPDAVLCVLANKRARLGLVFLDISRVARAIARILE